MWLAAEQEDRYMGAQSEGRYFEHLKGSFSFPYRWNPGWARKLEEQYELSSASTRRIGWTECATFKAEALHNIMSSSSWATRNNGQSLQTNPVRVLLTAYYAHSALRLELNLVEVLNAWSSEVALNPFSQRFAVLSMSNILFWMHYMFGIMPKQSTSDRLKWREAPGFEFERYKQYSVWNSTQGFYFCWGKL